MRQILKSVTTYGLVLGSMLLDAFRAPGGPSLTPPAGSPNPPMIMLRGLQSTAVVAVGNLVANDFVAYLQAIIASLRPAVALVTPASSSQLATHPDAAATFHEKLSWFQRLIDQGRRSG